mmetsp:Transcript_17260/g.42627  ORF Transcript_17260/g.42627 Transcript_17260/m.42627 type:complete len:208 (-) Transcript_17260:763-1386(-)
MLHASLCDFTAHPTRVRELSPVPTRPSPGRSRCEATLREHLVRGNKGRDHEWQVAKMRDQRTRHALVRVATAVAVDVHDTPHGPRAHETRGGDGEHDAVDQREHLAHTEPLQGVLVRTLRAIELLGVRVALLGIHLRVLDVVLLARRAHLEAAIEVREAGGSHRQDAPAELLGNGDCGHCACVAANDVRAGRGNGTPWTYSSGIKPL